MTPPAAILAGGPDGRSRRAPPIRVMIVDDSATALAVLSRMISSHDDLEVVAQARNVAEALDALRRTRADIVLLDIEMPGANGLEALPEIVRLGAGARVLVVSSTCEDGAEATLQALALGAADTLSKPGTGSFGGHFSAILADRIRKIGRAGADPAEAGIVDDSSPLHLREMPDGKLGCVAIGASTGGLHALSAFLKHLPARIGAPILVTQHLPALFMPFFAKQLQTESGRSTKVAADDQPLVEDEILIAPGDAHLTVERQGDEVRVKLCCDRALSGCLPSADPMLSSVALIYGRSAVGIILSGMGRDGFAGSMRLIDAGGAILAQDRRTSAVWGMPRVVAEGGLCAAVASPAELASRVAARAGSATWN